LPLPSLISSAVASLYNRGMKHFPLIGWVTLFLGLIGAAVFGQQPPATAPADHLITPMRIQQFPAVTVLCGQARATLGELTGAIEQLMPAVQRELRDNHLEVTGPPIFVYRGMVPDPTQPFTLEIGFPVSQETRAANKSFTVKKLEALRCATVLFSGPVGRMGEAHQALFGAIFAAGRQPAGEVREMYLYWEGPQSPNNVVLIQAEVR